MRHVKAGLMLIILMFTNLVLAVATQPVMTETFDVLDDVATNSGHYDDVHPFFTNLNKVFWLVFILSAIGLIIWYLASAHTTEYEQYEQYGRR